MAEERILSEMLLTTSRYVHGSIRQNIPKC